MNLALKYRPHEFKDVVGQRAISTILAAMVAKQSLYQVLLFTGPSGVGKTSMARIIAAQLNSEGVQEVREGRHPSVLEIDGASNGSVAAIRDLKKDLNYAVPGVRVIIIDEVHSISGEAFDALKEMLEFPRKNVYFILCTTEAHKLEAAVRHRCDRYNFKRASVSDLREMLKDIVAKEQIEIDSALINFIAQRSEGSYREATMQLEQIYKGNIHTIDEYNELQGEVDYGPVLLESALSGPVAAITKLESVLYYANAEDVADRVVETIKDIMLVKSGITLTYTGAPSDVRMHLASKLNGAQLLKAIKIIWDLQTKLSSGDTIRGLEMAFAMIGEAFQVNTPTVDKPATSNVSSAPMSLAAMQQYKP